MEEAQLGAKGCQLPGPHVVGWFHEGWSPRALFVSLSACVLGGGLCVCTCACACLGGVCDRQKEKAGAAPSWAPPGNNWFHSFMPSLLTSISSVSSGRVPGPALGAGASLGPGTHPFLPWRNSQSREEPDQEKQKAIPSGKWIWWKRHWIWQECCRWELCS